MTTSPIARSLAALGVAAVATLGGVGLVNAQAETETEANTAATAITTVEEPAESLADESESGSADRGDSNRERPGRKAPSGEDCDERTAAESETGADDGS